ncbi:MAG: ABC transporter permease, partial [Candidatus Omnitrophica bacterium]|nr:ABC transporter permease [Candidatus Omnitrophota bacterium]
MTTYLLRRLLGIIPLLLGITVISFAVVRLAPGEPVSIESSLNPRISPEVRQRLIAAYDLDKPLHVQYARWLNRFIRFDFGRSFSDSRPVAEKIIERLPLTVGINALSLALILCIGIPLGVRCALKEGKAFDKITTVLVFAGFAIPSFWLALLLMNLFGIQLGWVPISGV